MNKQTGLQPERRVLATLCILAVLALLWATLWPFNPHPKNEVTWLPDANGIRFGYGGVVFTQTALPPRLGIRSAIAGTGCAIEILLRPATTDLPGNILTFSTADNPESLVLRQWSDSLLVYRALRGRGPLKGKFLQFDVDGILPAGRLVLVTISSGPQGTLFYADGKQVAAAPRFRILPGDLRRQIVMGNSTTNFQAWVGQVRGLAVYDAELTPAEVSAHYADWIAGDAGRAAGSFADSTAGGSARGDHDLSNALAWYAFSERGGDEIHSEVASAPPITIPPYFSVPWKPRLETPANEYQPTRSWRNDVVENILGFMPLGFVLAGYFALGRSRAAAILLATLCGGLLSFSVEFLQYYIPRRDSGWTDVITNTTGTLLGALIARPEWVRRALRLVNLLPAESGDGVGDA